MEWKLAELQQQRPKRFHQPKVNAFQVARRIFSIKPLAIGETTPGERYASLLKHLDEKYVRHY